MSNKNIEILIIGLLLYAHPSYTEKQPDFFNTDKGEFYSNAKLGLMLRDSPSQNAKKIDLIPFNSKVHSLTIKYPGETISGVYGYWRKIEYKNKIGWAFGGFLTQTSPNAREKFEKGEKCKASQAEVELIDGRIIDVFFLDDQEDQDMPCILNHTPRFIGENILVRKFYISKSKNWAIVLTGTDIVGTIYLIDLMQEKSYNRTYLSFQILSSGKIRFLERIDCHTGRWIFFEEGTFSSGTTERNENCQM
jgi:hypothetical protein